MKTQKIYQFPPNEYDELEKTCIYRLVKEECCACRGNCDYYTPVTVSIRVEHFPDIEELVDNFIRGED